MNISNTVLDFDPYQAFNKENILIEKTTHPVMDGKGQNNCPDTANVFTLNQLVADSRIIGF